MDKLPELASQINIQLLINRWVKNNDAESQSPYVLISSGEIQVWEGRLWFISSLSPEAQTNG